MSFVGPIGKGKKTFNIVRQVNVDDTTLKAVARALGIPPAEHDRIELVSGEIVIGPAPTPTATYTAAQGGCASSSSDE